MITNQTERLNFASTKNIPAYPDFLDVQVKSFKDFFQLETKSDERGNEGLYNTFMENFPITDTRNNFVLEFLDYFVDPPRYTIQECIERGLTYSVPLKARLKLYCTDPEHEDFETIVQDVYLGTIPYMTPSGTFVINGAERVVVSQLHRSPGVFFGQSFHANGTKLYSARVIPFKGSWIEFSTDINSVMYAYIDRKKKLPVTTLLMALGFNRDDILNLFYENIRFDLTSEDEWKTKFTPENFKNFKLKNDLINAETKKVVIKKDTKVLYPMALKLKKEGLNNYLVKTADLFGKYLANDIINEKTGEVIAESGDEVTNDLITKLTDLKIKSLYLLDIDGVNRGPFLRNTLTVDKNLNQDEANG